MSHEREGKAALVNRQTTPGRGGGSPRPEVRYRRCTSCGAPLLQPGEFHGMDLCGPCCTGEASTHGVVTIQCSKFGCQNCAEELPTHVHEKINWTRACREHR